MFKKIMSLLLIITVSFYDSLCSDYPKNNPVQETDLAKLNTAQLKESLLNQAKMLDEATYNETIEIFNFSNASLTSFAELFLKNSYKKEYCKIILKNLKAYIKNRKNFASVTANTSEPKGINTNKELLHQYRNKGVIEAISSILEKQESAYEKIQTVRKNLQHWIENFYKEQEGESFIKKMGRLESKEIQQTLPSEEIMNNNLEKILLNFKVNKIPKDISALELPEISDTTAVYYVKHFFNDGTNNQNAKKLLEQYSTNKKIQKNANTLKSKGIEEAYITYAYDQKMHFDTWFYKLPITDKLEIYNRYILPPEKNDAFHGLQSIYLFLLDHESAGLLKKDISQYTTTPKIKMPNTKDKNFIEIPSSKKPSQCNRFFHNSFFRWPQQNPKKLILLVALTLAGVYEYKNKLRRLFL